MPQPVVEQTGTIVTTGEGRPDYQSEVHRAKQVYGYTLEEGEELLWLCTIAVPTPPGPGASAITVGGLAPGATLQAVDCATGLSVVTVDAGDDYIIKEFWVSFDQPVRFLLHQGGTFNDVSCLGYFEANAKPANIFQVGWTRGLLEDLSVASTLRCDVTNLSPLNTAYGKVWLLGYMKTGRYQWV